MYILNNDKCRLQLSFLGNISTYSENCLIPRQEVFRLHDPYMDNEITS